jgi:TonB family protein
VLTDCKKIEHLLWQYPDGEISAQEKADIKLQLSKCAECVRAFETISLLRESSLATQESANSIDAHAFDSTVMRKIELLKKPLAVTTDPSRQYVIRMALSFAVAATIVLFMVKSMSDLGNLTPPYQASKKTAADSMKEHDYFNITLGESKGNAPTKDQILAGSANANATKQVENRPAARVELPAAPKQKLTIEPNPSPPATTPSLAARAPIESTKVALKLPNLTIAQAPIQSSEQSFKKAMESTSGLVAAPTNLHARGGRPIDKGIAPVTVQRQSGYSILSKPVYQSGPDSVNIEGVYLTGDNIPLNKQSSAASLSEVITDTGAVQITMPQTSMLVTIDKMPEIIDMPAPEYPVWAKKRGLSAIVWVKAKIDRNGDISEANVISASMRGAGFEEAAIQAARMSKFHPAELNGRPLEVWIIYPVKFIFQNNSGK